MLAAILREELGSALVTEKLNDRINLPSPEELKYRILFKVSDIISYDSVADNQTKPPEFKIKPASAPTLSPRDSSFSFDFNATDSTTSESDSGIARLARRLSIGSNNSSKSNDNPQRSPKTKTPTFSQELSDLLVYTHGVKYSGFSKLITYEPRHQFSVSEKTGAKLIKENKQDWIKHNFNHISRVYPKGLRLQSTNYDPVAFWSAGCQLVAVNWQTVDEGAILNHAMFVDTNGYVLKPLALRHKTLSPEKRQKYAISVSIISAQRLPLSSDLRVEVTLGEKTRTTKSIEGCTLSPTWNETFTYELECLPSMLDLTFLHIEIKHPKSKQSMLAQWVRTLGVAPRGFRYLPLYDALFSKYVFATIFVNITIDPIA
jgi:phosphatidylinositol phospholipase C delta